LGAGGYLVVLSAFGGTRGTDRHCGGTTGEPGSGLGVRGERRTRFRVRS